MTSSHELPQHPGLTPPCDPYLDYGPALPERTGFQGVIAIARDPDCVWAWWEFPTASTVLLRDVERGVIERRDAAPAGTAFFAVQPGRIYVVEVDGRLSAPVRTPRRGAGDVDPAWTPDAGELEVLAALRLRTPEGGSSSVHA